MPSSPPHHGGVLIEASSIAELPKQRCRLFHLFYQAQIRLGSPPALLVLRIEHMRHNIVMAGVVPAIHVLSSPRTAGRRCVDARIKSGQDELVGIMNIPIDSEHSCFCCFLQRNISQTNNCKNRNTGISSALVIPMLRIPAERWTGPSKRTLSPVPPVLSGPDQARFSQRAEEPWAGPDDADNSAIIGHAHAITHESFATVEVSI